MLLLSWQLAGALEGVPGGLARAKTRCADHFGVRMFWVKKLFEKGLHLQKGGGGMAKQLKWLGMA